MILPTVVACTSRSSPPSFSVSSESEPCCSCTTSSSWCLALNMPWVTCDRFELVSLVLSLCLLIYSSDTSNMPRKDVKSFKECENFGGIVFSYSIEKRRAYSLVSTFPNLMSSNFSIGKIGTLMRQIVIYSYPLWTVCRCAARAERECGRALCYICSRVDGLRSLNTAQPPQT